jgi:TatD DNase family protein
MALIDTHSHIYLPQFDEDRVAVVERSLEEGVVKIFLPNIDSSTIGPMLSLCNQYPSLCYPMMGLHPTSVKEGFEKEMERVAVQLQEREFIGIGECGIDLYWDKAYAEQQKEVFSQQIRWALEYDLPLVIHARESFQEIYAVLEKEWQSGLKGVFHSFTGTRDDVDRINAFGFMFGINGIATFKNSGLDKIIPQIGSDKILLETDSPYLAPVPKRGKRNESSYLVHIAQNVAGVLGLEISELSEATAQNALALFNKIAE